jgi:diadenosine tetraphosphate (Ap4A) HIT family hydrolase
LVIIVPIEGAKLYGCSVGLLNFDEFPIIILIECPLNQQKYPISHFHIAGCREATRDGGGTIWKSSTAGSCKQIIKHTMTINKNCTYSITP